jgi:hypothetical protein
METTKERKITKGRPVKSVKKEIRAAIRFSKTEYFVIKEKAAKAGVKPAFYIRQTAIHAVVKPRLTEEERHFVRQLIGMANNLNQLAKSCHQEGVFKAMVYFESYRKKIDDILKDLSHGK